jgi:hypothetical protein
MVTIGYRIRLGGARPSREAEGPWGAFIQFHALTCGLFVLGSELPPSLEPRCGAV